MRYFPIFIDLQDQKIIVIGGGETATQKVRLLLKTDARITVIAETFTPELRGFEQSRQIATISRPFMTSDVEAARLVYAATGNHITDRAVAKAAQHANIPVNVVDDQDACSFITPAIVDRSPVVIAISTEGAAPVLAREIKSKLEAMLPTGFGALAHFAARLRPVVAQRIQNSRVKRQFWQRFFKSRARNLIFAGEDQRALQVAHSEIKLSLRGKNRIGKISLVGVGPGDPDLITLKAQRRLQEADVIVLDGLVNPVILEFARRDARRIYIGKTPGQASIKQSQIGSIMKHEALEGSQVLRLQGGDNLHFSRDIEALKPLESLGIEVEIIPGVSSFPLSQFKTQSDKIYAQAITAKG